MKAQYGSSDSDNKTDYAVKIDSLDRNDFFKEPFGRAINDIRKVEPFKQSAKVGYIGCKHKANNMQAVKTWLKENKPSQFFASWKKQTSIYKDDVITIYYID